MPPRSRNNPAQPEQPEQPAQAPTAQPQPTVQEAAQRRAAAMDGVKDADRNMVDALIAERRGYQQRDMDDRVAQVDEQLKSRGYRTS